MANIRDVLKRGEYIAYGGRDPREVLTNIRDPQRQAGALGVAAGPGAGQPQRTRDFAQREMAEWYTGASSDADVARLRAIRRDNPEEWRRLLAEYNSARQNAESPTAGATIRQAGPMTPAQRVEGVGALGALRGALQRDVDQGVVAGQREALGIENIPGMAPSEALGARTARMTQFAPGERADRAAAFGRVRAQPGIEAAEAKTRMRQEESAKAMAASAEQDAELESFLKLGKGALKNLPPEQRAKIIQEGIEQSGLKTRKDQDLARFKDDRASRERIAMLDRIQKYADAEEDRAVDLKIEQMKQAGKMTPDQEAIVADLKSLSEQQNILASDKSAVISGIIQPPAGETQTGAIQRLDQEIEEIRTRKKALQGELGFVPGTAEGGAESDTPQGMAKELGIKDENQSGSISDEVSQQVQQFQAALVKGTDSQGNPIPEEKQAAMEKRLARLVRLQKMMQTEEK